MAVVTTNGDDTNSIPNPVEVNTNVPEVNEPIIPEGILEMEGLSTESLNSSLIRENHGQLREEIREKIERTPYNPLSVNNGYSAYNNNHLNNLKNYEVRINFCNSGCVIHMGCSSVAFSSIKKGLKELKAYTENSSSVIEKWNKKFEKNNKVKNN